MNPFKLEIKRLAEKQRELKNQRKRDNIVGERTMPTYEAAWKHSANRYYLRHMNMAYGLLRGKTQEQVESNPKTPINMAQVEKFISINQAYFKHDSEVVCADKK